MIKRRALVILIAALATFGCNHPEAKSVAADWVLNQFTVKVAELNEADNSSYAPKPMNIEVFAAVENRAAAPVANVQLLVHLPEDTEYIKGIGDAEEKQAEVASGQSIQVAYTHKAPYTGLFKKDASLTTLEQHIKNSSSVIIKWQENGQLKQATLFPSHS